MTSLLMAVAKGGWLAHAWFWVEVHTGTVNEPGPYYGFWSGFGSDIGEVAIIGGLIAAVRHLNCHVTGCRRIRTHLVPGTPYRACREHHPTVPTHGDITAEHIADAHRSAQEASKSSIIEAWGVQ